MPEILIIDDYAADRYLMAEALSGAGYEVREANDGNEGLAAYRQHCPALVITDIVMAAKDGIETIRELRLFAPDVPIVAVSGTEYANVYLSAVRLLGADAVLAKPFSFDKLVCAVAALLNASSKHQFLGSEVGEPRSVN